MIATTATTATTDDRSHLARLTTATTATTVTMKTTVTTASTAMTTDLHRCARRGHVAQLERLPDLWVEHLVDRDPLHLLLRARVRVLEPHAAAEVRVVARRDRLDARLEQLRVVVELAERRRKRREEEEERVSYARVQHSRTSRHRRRGGRRGQRADRVTPCDGDDPTTRHSGWRLRSRDDLPATPRRGTPRDGAATRHARQQARDSQRRLRRARYAQQ